ncbi:protein kinase [candidate division KSB1 bacterium]|nr:protein kinase [candidate division KSB1 bacterium]
MRQVISIFFITQFLLLSLETAVAQDARQEAKKHFIEALKSKSRTEKVEGLKKTLEIYPEYEAAHLKLGEIYFEQGEYKKAIEEFRAEIGINPLRNPNGSNAWKYIGNSYLELGERTNAATAYETSLTLKRNTELFAKAIALYLGESEFSKAASALTKYRKNLSEADYFYYDGKIKLAQGNTKEALAAYEQALVKDSNHEPAKQAASKLKSMNDVDELARQATEAINAGEIDSAIKLRDQLAQKAPGHARLDDVDNQLAQYYARLATSEQNPDLALGYINRALEYGKNQAELSQIKSRLETTQELETEYQKAEQAIKAQQWQLAIRLLNQINSKDSNYKDVAQKLRHARTRYDAQPASVTTPLDTATTEKPPETTTDARAFVNQGKAAIEQNQWENAIKHFEAALSIEPSLNEAQMLLNYARGMSMLNLENWAFASNLLDKSLEITPDFQPAVLAKHYAVGRQKESVGEVKEALAEFESILGAEPTYRDVNQRLKALRSQTGAPAESGWLNVVMDHWEFAGGGAAALLVIILLLVNRSRRQQPAPRVSQAKAEHRVPPVKAKRKPSGQIKTIAADEEQAQQKTVLGSQRSGESKEPAAMAPAGDQQLIEEKTRLLSTEQDSVNPLIQDRYEVKSEIGKGAMGKVYKAYDHKMDRTVVLKEIRMDLDLGKMELEKLKRRFEREALSAGKLNHPNIVTIFDIVKIDTRSFISMEYIEGINLLHLLQQRKLLPPKEAANLVRQACSALAEAHSRGIVHRDIKPSNIMVMKNGLIKIVDFGVAKMADSSGTLTQAGSSLGTPSYMSPEQIEGKEIDGRSDIFSLGVVFYEMLTGVRPFKGDSIASIIVKIIQAKPRRITSYDNNLPVELENIVNKMMEKSPNNRYATAREIITDIDKTMPML